MRRCRQMSALSAAVMIVLLLLTSAQRLLRPPVENPSPAVRNSAAQYIAGQYTSTDTLEFAIPAAAPAITPPGETSPHCPRTRSLSLLEVESRLPDVRPPPAV